MNITKSGIYQLFETPRGIKILALGNTQAFVWLQVPKIGGLLVETHNPHTIADILAIGRFRLTEDGPYSLPHSQMLSLEIDGGLWQHYRLPTGLPTSWHKRSRIVPTFYVPALHYVNDQAALPV